MSQVVHCKKSKFDVYIGRKYQDMPASKWQNPYVIGRDGTREEVIAKYEAYLTDNEQLMAELPELKDKVLGCWCYPEKCHGDVLVKLLQENAKVESEKYDYSPFKQGILPIFSSHYSLGATSILSFEEAGKTKPGNFVSICDIAKENHLKQVVVVDERMDGILEAWKNLSKSFKTTPPVTVEELMKTNVEAKVKITQEQAVKIFNEASQKYAKENSWMTEPSQLVFGLKLTVVPDMLQKDDASRLQESNVIIFMKDVVSNPEAQSPSYVDLVRINNRAWTTGHYKGKGRIDWKTLKELWTSNLILALPFFSSFIQRNTLTFASIVPDLPCVPWIFKEVDSELPFASLIEEALDRYVSENNCPVKNMKSIYYADSASFKQYTILRALDNHGTFSDPGADNFASDRFSWQAYKELT